MIADPNNLLANALEACFFERSNGDVISILRRNSNDPCLIRLNPELTEFEILYGGPNQPAFNFPAYYNPTSLIKLRDGNFYLLAGSRRKDSNNKHFMIESIVSEQDLLNNNITNQRILKANAYSSGDWGYAQVVITNDGNIYGYFYDTDRAEITGTTQIYEMIGCY